MFYYRAQCGSGMLRVDGDRGKFVPLGLFCLVPTACSQPQAKMTSATAARSNLSVPGRYIFLSEPSVGVGPRLHVI